jgi:hypothetical protein
MPLKELPEPWTPAQATERIRELGRDPALNLSLRTHCHDQLADRSLIMSDLLYLLRNGFVYEQPEPATRDYWKYLIQCETPNSNNREVRVLVLPDWKRRALKAQTIMWADEPMISGRA